MKHNYQKELDALISGLELSGETPRLFLHSCCAPCSSYVLEYLSDYFLITLIYYNPNITDRDEYLKRVSEVRRLVGEMPTRHPITFVEGPYEPSLFVEAVKGYEKEPEGGARCECCFRMRLKKTAEIACGMVGDDEDRVYLSTTLTISPLKNAELLNDILREVSSCCEPLVALPSDFKKREGYKRSIELSRIYGLYRQNYCGCVYSRL